MRTKLLKIEVLQGLAHLYFGEHVFGHVKGIVLDDSLRVVLDVGFMWKPLCIT